MRTGWVLCFLLCAAPALHALDVTVFGSFKILDIVRTEEKLILPDERKKYHNVRITNRATYQFVLTCQQPCVQTLGDVVPVVQEIRPARTRLDMWIAQVDFNGAWLVTFLVFKHGDKLHIKPPQHVEFISDALKQKTYESVSQALKGSL